MNRHPLRAFVLGFAAFTVLGACRDGLEPNEARYLAPLLPVEMGLEAPNPKVTRVGERSWELEIVTYGGCQLLRTDTEVLHRGQTTHVFPYEIRKICPDRVRRIASHEVALSYRGDGPWTVLIMGESGVQWSVTLSVGGWDPR